MYTIPSLSANTVHTSTAGVAAQPFQNTGVTIESPPTTYILNSQPETTNHHSTHSLTSSTNNNSTSLLTAAADSHQADRQSLTLPPTVPQSSIASAVGSTTYLSSTPTANAAVQQEDFSRLERQLRELSELPMDITPANHVSGWCRCDVCCFCGAFTSCLMGLISVG